MHARAAYIRSFGTTGILLVASFLMLAMVGAVVGFHRWPGGSVVQNVPSVPLKPASTQHLRAIRTTPTPAHLHKAQASHRSRDAAAARAKSTRGLVKVVPVGSHPVGYPVGATPGQVSPTAGVTQPSSGAGDPAPQQPRPPAPPSAPPPPQPLATLVDEIVQSAPPVPAPLSQDGGSIVIQLPLAGVPAIKTPPLP